jgi:nucleotide-binding universal stress UspA family protein
MAPRRPRIDTDDGDAVCVCHEVKEGPMFGRVVVGVDGSATAKDAVRWAAREAKLRGTKLELVSAWEIPMSSYAFGYGIASIPEEMQKALVARAENDLAAALEEARAEAPDVEMETLVAEGQAASLLLDISREADLLVVGSRGLGGFQELLLGSVSQQCAHHSPCPVVIVRHIDEGA